MWTCGPVDSVDICEPVDLLTLWTCGLSGLSGLCGPVDSVDSADLSTLWTLWTCGLRGLVDL